MSRPIIIGLGVLVVAIAGFFAFSGGADDAESAATGLPTEPEGAASSPQDGEETTDPADSPPEEPSQAATPPEASEPEIDCTPTLEPHYRFNGIVTSLDGVAVPLSGEATDDLFGLGNAVQLIVPQAGGPAFTAVTLLVGNDSQFFSYSAVHESRGAHAPPDARAPENYLAWDASANRTVGTVGLAVETLDVGQLAGQPTYVTSTYDAQYDVSAGVLTGTITHPDAVLEFTADQIDEPDLAVYPTPECFAAAVEFATETDNPSSP